MVSSRRPFSRRGKILQGNGSVVLVCLGGLSVCRGRSAVPSLTAGVSISCGGRRLGPTPTSRAASCGHGRVVITAERRVTAI